MLLLWLVVLLIGAAYLTHRRLPPLQIIGIVAAYTLLMGIFSSAPGWLLVLIWLPLAAITALLVLPDWRRKVFTGRVFSWFQKTLPPMSQTEREAIDAGTVWWDGQLFSGQPNWNTLLDYPHRSSQKKNRRSSTARPTSCARWSATGRSARTSTCRLRPGRISRRMASSP